MKHEPPLLIDPKSAAAQLGIGLRTLQSLTSTNAIPSVLIGRCRRYATAELLAWVDAGCPTQPGSASAVRKAVAQ